MTKSTQPIIKAASDLGREAAQASYRPDPLEVGHAMSEDVLENIWICIDKHRKIIDEPEFCVVMLITDDSMVKNLRRIKYYAWPFMPKPRPNQAVFYYHKPTDQIQRLWVLPPPKTMAIISSMVTVAPQWRTMRGWAMAFYDGTFFEHIRKESRVDLLSEEEYSKANRDKLASVSNDEFDPLFSETFDFSKVAT